MILDYDESKWKLCFLSASPRSLIEDLSQFATRNNSSIALIERFESEKLVNQDRLKFSLGSFSSRQGISARTRGS